jgi:hypothetical protein
MEDLTAASYDDTVEFFKRYYALSNATGMPATSKWCGVAPRRKWPSDAERAPSDR